MQRKPSHFGSYCQPSPVGISSTKRDSIGGNGGFSSMFEYRFAAQPLVDTSIENSRAGHLAKSFFNEDQT
jgi:hypothetical protein